MTRKHSHTSKGQALLEFALIITVLMTFIFLIIEAGRILWAWNQVQNAAKEAARYAITGQVEEGDCATLTLPKFADICSEQSNYRAASVILAAHNSLNGIPLNEDANSAFESENYYVIKVYGGETVIDPETGQSVFVLRGTDYHSLYSSADDPYQGAPFAGTPGLPVIVNVTYRVPIITPFLSGILPSIPVFGQTVLNNESFDSLGGTGQSVVGLPPDVSTLVPTVGVTPSFTPTPTPGDTSTPTPLPNTATATPEVCPIRFTNPSEISANNTLVGVTAVLQDSTSTNRTVEIYDEDTGALIGTGILLPSTGAACSGSIGINVNPALVAGHTIRAEITDADGYESVSITVLVGTNTPTNTPTNTNTPTPTSTATQTLTPTPTPPDPFITIDPDCGFPPNEFITVLGFNWPATTSVVVRFDGQFWGSRQTNASGFFSFAQTSPNFTSPDTITILVEEPGGESDSVTFDVPCTDVTITPDPNTPTPTPRPVDLTIGELTMISTPPIVGYQPVQFRMVITNTGEVDVSDQFFSDIFLDPTNVFTDYIPIPSNPAYVAIGSLPGTTSQVITITSDQGFTGPDSERSVYAMVDSLRQISEITETNNIVGALQVSVTPVDPPTPTATSVNTDTIQGFVRSFVNGGWAEQPRAQIWLEEETASPNPIIVGPFLADLDGNYTSPPVPPGVTFTVISCLPGTNLTYVRSGVIVPNVGIGLFMRSEPTGCIPPS